MSLLEIAVGQALYVGERPLSPNTSTIVRLDADGGATQVAAFQNLGDALGLVAVDGPAVYFEPADTSSSAMLRMTLPPYDASTAVGCADYTLGIATDASYIYWTTSSRASWSKSPPSVMRAPKPY